jgi:hypothetical protein
MNVSEDTFVFWSTGPSETEAEKCENAESVIRKAIAADAAMQKLDISVFAQGSYRARTNVRQNSDVDICVRYNGSFFPEYLEGVKQSDVGNVDSDFSYAKFKDMLQAALESRFGVAGVTRGKKAFDVHANSYRIDADVVPVFEHRRYIEQNPDGSYRYCAGVAFQPDDGGLVINWPKQTYDNGVSKNTSNGRKYKRTIRILKRMRDEMKAANIAEAKVVSSFLIECLVWNANTDAFKKTSYTDVLRYVIADLWNRTRSDTDCDEWGEVNELKYLFRSSQPWTRNQANDFLQKCWDYIGYK